MFWKRRDEFDFTSEGGAFSAESVSTGKGWKPAKKHWTSRLHDEKPSKPESRQKSRDSK
jgi:hypothetical protein